MNHPGEQHFCIFCKTPVIDKVHGMMLWVLLLLLFFFSLNTGGHAKFLGVKVWERIFSTDEFVCFILLCISKRFSL